MSHLSPYLDPTYIDFPILIHPIMSTTSTVTASVACDLTLGNGHKIVNQICILVTIHGDETPFSHNSFQEEDLVELCMGLGPDTPGKCATALGDQSSPHILIYFQNDGCNMCLRCSHGMV